jgi:hypothetical protein
VYGTGKSAFAHFLLSLLGPTTHPARQVAVKIAEQSLQPHSPEYQALQQKFPDQGLFRAVATAQREPFSHTLVRALKKAADDFWQSGRAPSVARCLTDWQAELEAGQPSFCDRDILHAVKQLAETVTSDIVIIIDELGKNLEYAPKIRQLLISTCSSS